MSYRSLSIIAIMLSAVPMLEGMKHLNKIQAIKRAIIHNNPALQYLNEIYSQKDNEPSQKEPKKQGKTTIVEIPYGQNVTVSSKDDHNKMHAIKTLQDDQSIVATFIKKQDGTEYANIGYGTLGNCSIHCSLLQGNAAFLKEHGQEEGRIQLHVLVPGVYKQHGAHYRLVPAPGTMHHCYEDLFGLPRQSHNIKKLDINSGDELEEAVMNPPLREYHPLAIEEICQYIDNNPFFSVMVYDPQTLAREKKRYPFDWALRFNKKGSACLKISQGLEYPRELFKRDFVRWLCQPMEKEQKRAEAKKDAHNYFFELIKAQEGFNRVIARVKEEKAHDPKALAILDNGKKKNDQLVQGLSWWLFKNL